MKGNEKQILTCLGKCRIAPDQHQHSTLATFAFFFVVTWDADALLWWRRKREKLNLVQTTEKHIINRHLYLKLNLFYRIAVGFIQKKGEKKTKDIIL